jgi:hypothetical protein
LTRSTTKISFIIILTILFSGCNAVKRVPDNKQLLVRNVVMVNEKKTNQEEITSLIQQQPNSTVLKVPFSLYLYNLARPNPDSLFEARVLNNPKRYRFWKSLISEKQVHRLGESFWYKGKHELLKKMGEEPVIIEDNRTKRSELRLKTYFFNNGFFDVKVSTQNDSVGKKRGQMTYRIDTGDPYILDSLTPLISSPKLDSLYQLTASQSYIKKGEQFNSQKFDQERNRITSYFRNHGVYNFQQNYINFNIDTIATQKRPNVDLVISDFNYRSGDTLLTKPFEIYKISEVNIYTDSPSSRSDIKITDSITHKNYRLFSVDKLKFKPQAITDAIFISPGNLYADFRNTLTSRYISNLRVFNFPSIQYIPDPKDSIGNSLIANIYLSPRKKYQFGFAVDFTHSNIQDFGISGNTSLSIRNIFKGAETLEIAARGNIGSSRELANPNDDFFNLSEIGLDARINFPRIFFPFNTERIIPKSMIPSTQMSVGFAKQTNIGLDKENFTSFLTYNWNPKRQNNVRFDLFNIQYVKNLRTDRYFEVYRSSYNALNQLANTYRTPEIDSYFDERDNLIIESGTNAFLNDVLGQNPSIFPTNNDLRSIRSIEERRQRLIENNLIVASSYSFSKTTRTGILDSDFYIFRTKFELAGNALSLLAKATGQSRNANNNYTFIDIEFSQYVKNEVEFIKHWDLRRHKVIAMRLFSGIAIPYGNSNNIPFSRSYFAGGSNDNRAWRPFSLGPGSTSAQNDFNEANLKLAFSTEFRFKLFGSFRGALFTDIGNIWNVLDNTSDPDATFSGFQSLQDIAIGSGFGLRYDFSFFVVRLDMGFKTYNPANEMERRWFNEYNFKNSVLNIGINYPF